MPKQKVRLLAAAAVLAIMVLLTWHKPLVERVTGTPRTAGGFVKQGKKALQAAELGEAVAAFQQAAELEPDNAEIHYFLAQALDAAGRRDQAVRSYGAAVALNPLLASPRFNLAVIHRLQGDYSAMEKELQKAVEAAGGFPSAHLLLGALYYNRADWERAVTEFTQALKNPAAVIVNPESVRTMLEQALSRLGKDQTTAEYLGSTAVTPDTRLCGQCHLTDRIRRSHTTIQGGRSNCLECHAPHSLTGSPGLPSPAEERCTTCHFDYAAANLTARKEQEGLLLHDPLEKLRCSDCHEPHELGVPSSFKGGGPNASCAGCHSKSTEQKGLEYQHGPFQENFCTDCHDAHASSQPALLRMPQGDLCTICHDQTLAQKELPSQHKPFSSGFCTDCHNPHASSSPAVLRVPPDQLCATCHRPEEKATVSQHAPYRDGRCEQCHSPHASPTQQLLRTSSQTELCTSCHARVGTDLKLISRHPVGQQIQCSNCHKPHTAEAPSLLQAQGRALCSTCHPAQGMMLDLAAHRRLVPEGTGGVCTACHRAHGSTASPLLTNTPMKLCSQCHDPKSGLQHPMGSAVIDPTTSQAVVCSSCHDPHGSSEVMSLRRPVNGLCLACHDK